jgi:hypothetical protein
MFLPWRGIFEQIKLADVYVHYDDVQYPLGRSFMNRVQVKTPNGIQWLTVPVKKSGKEPQLIKDVVIDDTQDWRSLHLKILKHMYGKSPFYKDMFSLVTSIYSFETNLLSDMNIYGIELIAKYFNISPRFLRSSELNIYSHSSEKLLEVMLKLTSKIYITGHGALNYLDYDLFERNGIQVEYIDYCCTPYPQSYGDFTPYVSILDLIANTGKNGINYMDSPSIYWRDFIGKRN